MNECCPNSFSYEGLELLFGFLEECENSGELDPIAINSSYEENTLRDIIKEYSLTIQIELDEKKEVLKDESMTDEQVREVVEEYLKLNTCLVGITSDTAVYMSF